MSPEHMSFFEFIFDFPLDSFSLFTIKVVREGVAAICIEFHFMDEGVERDSWLFVKVFFLDLFFFRFFLFLFNILKKPRFLTRSYLNMISLSKCLNPLQKQFLLSKVTFLHKLHDLLLVKAQQNVFQLQISVDQITHPVQVIKTN